MKINNRDILKGECFMKLYYCLLLVLFPWLALQAMEAPSPRQTKKKIHVNQEISSKPVPKNPAAAQAQAEAEKKAVEALCQGNIVPELTALYDFLTLSSFRYLEETAAQNIWLLRKLMYALTHVEEIYAHLKAQNKSYDSIASGTVTLLKQVTELGCADATLINLSQSQSSRNDRELLSNNARNNLAELINECINFLTGYTNDLRAQVSQAYDTLEKCDQKCNALTDEVVSLEQTTIIMPTRGNSARPTFLKKMNDYHAKSAKRDAEIEAKKKELEDAQVLVEPSCKQLGKVLWEFKQKTFHIAANQGCAQFNMAELPEELVLKIFNRLEKKKNKEFFELCTTALTSFKPHLRLYTGLIYTLQQYICCAYYDPERASAKGPAWEIAVALFLYDSCKECAFGNLLTMNDFVSSSSALNMREFDHLTERLLIECKSCSWKWECPSSRKEDIEKHNHKKSKLADQLFSQKSIALYNNMRFLLLSKQRLDRGWAEWCYSKRIKIDFIDSSDSTHDLIRTIARLYQKPYFIE